MNQSIKQEIIALGAMTATQLRARYRELFGEESRSSNRQWLYRRCAWRVQAMAEGDMPERLDRLRRQAMRIANDADIRVIPPRSPTPAPTAPRRTVRMPTRGDDRLPTGVGTVLTRVFKGRQYQVMVLPKGFQYDNRIYKSLTAVAHAITGSHWNGYHFFRESLIHAKQEGPRDV